MISVPLTNPVRFRPLTGITERNFDNSFADDWNGLQKSFAQIVAPDEWIIQVVSDTDYYDEEAVSSDLVIRLEYSDGTEEYLPDPPIVFNVGYNWYYLFTIRPAFTGCFQMIVEIFSTGVDYFRSEWCEVQSGYVDTLMETNTDVRKIEWFNHTNDFVTNYVESGFVGKAWVEAKMYLMAAAGDSIIFDNMGTEVKLKEVVQRVLKFEAELPDYLCEILTIAMAHDRFYINDVEYVLNKKPAISQYGRSNWYKFECELKQSTVLGLNTHDTGFDCDAMTTEVIMNILNTGKTSSFTVEIPANYLLHVITATYTDGTTTDFSVGTAPDGTDIMGTVTLTAANPLESEIPHIEYPAADTIYCTLDGDATIDVNIQLIYTGQ